MKFLHSLVLVLATLIMSVTAGPVALALDYPVHTVRIVVGFGPGTSPDIVARLLGDTLFQAWGKPVVIENAVGANGNIAGERVAWAEPDGHTLLLAANPVIVVNPSLYEKMPFDPVRDLVPISQVCAYANILIVNNDVPAKNVQELVAVARARPGTLTYGSSGFGSTQHLAGELLKSMARVDILHVPYRSAFGQEIVAGRLSMAFVPPTSALLPLARDGKVRALAVTSLERYAGAPDLPTMAESGFPGFEVTVWFGLMAPARTPPAIVEKLHRETVRILAIPEMRKRFDDLGIKPIGNSPAEFAAAIDGEIPKWASLIRGLGIKLLD
jgi:tripartite-type tricarboxylate transporter receptor subunit TctC